MATALEAHLHLEVGHILFLDIVGYSKLSINHQHAAVEQLNQIVRATGEFQKADASQQLIKIATGDGMALVFYTSPEAPAQCAVEISRALKEHPRLQLRMGIHSGPVSGVVDVNERANLAGAGINVAQRIMECGDAGHILLSKHVAEDLAEFEEWRPLLHDLGTCEVKHGVRVSVVNLYDDQLGNATLPRKFEAVQKRRARMRWAEMAIALLVLAAIATTFVFLLRRPTRSAVTLPEKSIAVLPFENLSRDPDNAYFADGVQEEILTRLAKVADLKVISRTSTLRYQSKPGNLSEIAKQLGVTNILEGSVQKAADQVRVNVQLVNAQTDSHLWAETYDRKVTDIFGIESEIAKGIADSLQAKLTGREEQALAVKPTNNPEAYDAYLRGLAFAARAFYAIFELPKAVSFFERAVQLDPTFALAWARLSRANVELYYRGYDTSASRRDAAKRALDTAQKLEPNSSETLLALAYYQYQVLRDNNTAKATYGLVAKMLPSSSEPPQALGAIARREGRWDQSITYYEQALILNPRDSALIINVARTYTMTRQFPAALKMYDRALDILPNDPDLMASKASIYQAEGNLQEAAKLLAEMNVQTPSPLFGTKIDQLTFERNYGETVRLWQALFTTSPPGDEFSKAGRHLSLALAQRFAGDSAGAKVNAEQACNILERLCKDQPDNALRAAALARAYAFLGNKDAALKEAKRAIALVPTAKDAMNGPAYEENLAVVEVMFGEDSDAISIFSRLLQIPYRSQAYGAPLTPALLRLDPFCDPLRADPDFQKLCEEKQP